MKIFKCVLILIIFFLHSCDRDETEELIESNVKDDATEGITKNISKCQVTVKSLASHTQVIYHVSKNSNTIRVNERSDGQTLTIRTKSGVCKITKPFDELIIYGGKGVYSIIINPSVKTPTMVYPGDGRDFLRNASDAPVIFMTLGDKKDKVIGNKMNTRFWMDPEDTHNASPTEINQGKLHIVNSFENSNKILDG